MSSMYVDFELLMNYTCEQIYEHLNKASLDLYVVTVTLIFKFKKLEFDYGKMLVATAID